MPKIGIDRQLLATITKNPQAIVALERVFNEVGGIPSTIEEANALAAQAVAAAHAALAMLADLSGTLEQLAAAPAPAPAVEPDDFAPRAQLGTISPQNADAVDITGGTVGLDAGAEATPSFYLGGDKTTGLYRSAADVLAIAVAGAKLAELSAMMMAITGSLSVSQQLISTVGTGTAPLVVNSTTLVPNLYVARAAAADSATNAGHANSADSLTSPSSYPPNATDLPTVIALANALRAAAQSKGL